MGRVWGYGFSASIELLRTPKIKYHLQSLMFLFVDAG